MKKSTQKALVVMSGGQDSTTCLAVALSECEEVSAVTFTYGQKHAKELEAARMICLMNDAPLQEIDLAPVLQSFQSSALVNHGDTSKPHEYIKDVPASFVPVRNALFLTSAFGVAMENGCQTLYTGVCQTDSSGYPDCRELFINQLEIALNIGYNQDIRIRTPLMHLDKAQTFKLAKDLGWLDIVINHTLTCYNGDVTMNDWGRGCGECPACLLRKKGYEEFLAAKEE